MVLFKNRVQLRLVLRFLIVLFGQRKDVNKDISNPTPFDDCFLFFRLKFGLFIALQM